MRTIINTVNTIREFAVQFGRAVVALGGDCSSLAGSPQSSAHDLRLCDMHDSRYHTLSMRLHNVAGYCSRNLWASRKFWECLQQVAACCGIAAKPVYIPVPAAKPGRPTGTGLSGR
jgi:hypothetical protein